MRWFRTLPIVLLLVACGGSAADTDGDGTTGEPDYPSDFTMGKHRATSLVLEPEGQGADFDGDGDGDNNLPFVLETADEILNDLDLSLETFAEQIATSIEDGDLNVLLDSSQTAGALDIAVLSGIQDEETQELAIDPQSLNDDGSPSVVLTGAFSTDVDFSVTAERAILVVPFVPDEPPARVPLERVTLSGTLNGEQMDAVITGVIPAEQLADDVLAGLIPEEGVGNLSKERLLSTLRTLSGLETIADIDLGDERRGVSCAFSIEGEAASWAE